MRVHLGSDHAGYELKEHLVGWLKAAGHEPVDAGPSVYDALDDYPPFVLRAAEGTANDPGSLGIVIGGSGNGEQIAARKRIDGGHGNGKGEGKLRLAAVERDLVEAARERWLLFPLTVVREKDRIFIQVAERGFLAAAGQRADAAAF